MTTRNLMMASCGLTLILGIIPAWANGFDSADLRRAASRIAPDQGAQILARNLAATDRLRAGFALDPQTAWQALEDGDRGVLFEAFGPFDRLTEFRLGWFFRSSISAGTSMDAGARTSLYNPAADIWLVLDWRQVGGEARLSSAHLAARGTGSLPDWSNQGGAWGHALGNSTAAAFRAFGEEGQVATAGSNSLALSRIDSWLGSIAALHGSANWQQRWKGVQQKLNATKQSGALAELPLPVRRSLAPMGFVARADNESVVLVSPLYPELVVLADFDAANAATLTPHLLIPRKRTASPQAISGDRP